mmetsp:Transcript_62128/g.139992  ORF Transcript_62128/g.139992 Transcript_62128/m.139992 type:complete len:203 (+) Transcript_62128:187-795(+)
MHSVHLRLPVLLVHVPLFFHLSDRVAVLLYVNLVRGALHSQAVDLLAELEDVALVLAQAALHAAHPEVESTQASRSLGASKFGLLLNGRYLLEGLLLLLSDVVLQASLCVRDVALQVATHHCNLIEAVTERVLRRVQALLGCGQVLVRKVDTSVEGIHRLVGVARYLGLGLLKVCLHRSDVVPDGGQDLVHLPAASINIQSQ